MGDKVKIVSGANAGESGTIIHFFCVEDKVNVVIRTEYRYITAKIYQIEYIAQ